MAGELSIGGAKNAVLPILAASVLNRGVNVIHNCPRILDTFVAVEILEVLGCKVSFIGNTIKVNSSNVGSCEVPVRLMTKMRAAIIFMGSLMSAYGEAQVCYPGGCDLGPRLINQHLSALRKMGATITEENNCLLCEGRLYGKHIHMNLPSVGATQNVMLAAVLAEGVTVITNAAKEPEIYDLQVFLCKMGANVCGAGTDTIIISGVKKLHDAEHTIMPDRIIAGTYLAAAAIVAGEVVLRNVQVNDMIPITYKLEEMGCKLWIEPGLISLIAPHKLCAADVTHTLPHPGFPTDMQAQLTAVACVAKGESVIHETVFSSRLGHVQPLIAMGADIAVSPNKAVFTVNGVSKLYGKIVAATDLRGGAGLILAGLYAEGETIVTDSLHVERGYETIVEDLAKLGANIRFVKDVS